MSEIEKRFREFSGDNPISDIDKILLDLYNRLRALEALDKPQLWKIETPNLPVHPDLVEAVRDFIEIGWFNTHKDQHERIEQALAAHDKMVSGEWPLDDEYEFEGVQFDGGNDKEGEYINLHPRADDSDYAFLSWKEYPKMIEFLTRRYNTAHKRESTDRIAELNDKILRLNELIDAVELANDNKWKSDEDANTYCIHFDAWNMVTNKLSQLKEATNDR